MPKEKKEEILLVSVGWFLNWLIHSSSEVLLQGRETMRLLARMTASAFACKESFF
jgi:hypothetical protein